MPEFESTLGGSLRGTTTSFNVNEVVNMTWLADGRCANIAKERCRSYQSAYASVSFRVGRSTGEKSGISEYVLSIPSFCLSLSLSFRFHRILWNFHRRGSSRNASYLILPINGTFDIFARFNRTTCVNESGNGNERKRLALSGKAGNEIINWNYEGGVGGWLKPNDSNFINSVYNLYPTGSRNWGVSVLISWNKLPRLPAGKELLVRPANRTIPFLLSVFTLISLWYEIVCSTDLIAFTLIVTEGCNEHSLNYTITYISLNATMKDRDNSKTRIYVYRDAHMIHTEYICTVMEAITRQFSGDAVSRYSFRVLVNDMKAIDETLNQMATFTRYAVHDTCIMIHVSSRET